MLIRSAGAMHNKEDVLLPYGVEKISDLTEDQLDDLIDRLNKVKPPADSEIRKQRSIVLSLCDDVGVKPKKGNWDAVNSFLLNPKIAGKVLYEMDLNELKDCAKRIRAFKTKLDKKIEEEKFWASNN